MHYVALVPIFLSAWWVVKKGVWRGFLDVYLPILLVLPDYFRCYLPGLPDPTMNQSAILPVAGFWLLRERGGWRFSGGDLLVGAFAFFTAYSEYLAKGYSEAQNLMFDVLTNMVFPYILMKAFVERKGLRLEFARRFILLMTIVAVTLPYESKMTLVLIRLPLNPFFAGQGNWTPTARYGLIRAAGPYGHAILAGLMFVVAYRIQRWLEWSGGWEGKVRWLGIARSKFYTWAMLAASVLTLVRGPWIGGFASGGVLLVCRAKNRRAVGMAFAAFLVVVGIPGFLAFWSWAGVGRANAASSSQETACYRRELIEGNLAIAAQHALWGWGRGGAPKIPGMESTDNQFLLLALNHGLVAMLLFLAIFAWHITKLLKLGLKLPREDATALLAFNLAGAYVVFLVSLATVYHGMQTVQLFFLIAGWSDGLLTYGGGSAVPAVAGAAPAVEARPYSFRRVVT